MSNPISRFFLWSEQPEAKKLMAWIAKAEASNATQEELKALLAENEGLDEGSQLAWKRINHRLVVLQVVCIGLMLGWFYLLWFLAK